jgi:outer membrane protein assembly factor BamC
MAWLEIDAPPDQVFYEARSFISKVGFDIVSESATLGIMETNWKENIADIPQGWLGSLLNPLYQSEARDRYRIRLEPSDNGNKTRLFIAHQGLREKVEGEDNGIDTVQTKWILTPADPDLEAEMLMRFMIYRGVDKKVARKAVENAPVKQPAKLLEDTNGVILEIKQPFPRAWRHVGIALDRMGLQVEDRNRSAGVYYIRIPDNLVTKKGSDWFQSAYTGDEKLSSLQLLITVEDKGESSRVALRGRDTQPENISKIAEQFLKQLQSNII